MIKLYIFESVADALAFERPAPHTKPASQAFDGAIKESAEPEAPAQHRVSRNKINPQKEAMKQRIIAKAKAKTKDKAAKRTFTCKNCGKPGHMAKTCPETQPMTGDLTQEQINHIKEMADQGATISQIVIETGLPSKVVKENMY